MSVYWCDKCTHWFKKGQAVTEEIVDWEPYGESKAERISLIDSCPLCGSKELDEVHLCDVCGEHPATEDDLCTFCYVHIETKIEE